MRIVVVNRYFHPDQSATSRVVSGLAFQLASRGHQVLAVTSRHHHNRTDIVLPARESVDGVEIFRLAGSAFGRETLAGRMVDYLAFHLLAAWRLFFAIRAGDVCVLCTDPPLLSVTSEFAIAVRGGRMVNWVMDLFPETAIELGLMPKSSMLAAFCLWLRNRSHRKGALTICPTDTMTRYLRQCGERRVATVSHWSDGREILPIAPTSNSLRHAWGLENTFVVGYSGNFGRAHDFSTMLAAAERLRGRQDICFLLVGDGYQRQRVEAEVARRKLNNVQLRPFQPADMLAYSLSIPDVHVVSLLPALEHCIIPSKFYGVLAAGRPTLFVGSRAGEVASIVERFECGEAVELGDVDGMVRAILNLKSDTERRVEMGRNARRLFESRHERSAGVDAWLAAISGIEASKDVPVGRTAAT